MRSHSTALTKRTLIGQTAANALLYINIRIAVQVWYLYIACKGILLDRCYALDNLSCNMALTAKHVLSAVVGGDLC